MHTKESNNLRQIVLPRGTCVAFSCGNFPKTLDAQLLKTPLPHTHTRLNLKKDSKLSFCVARHHADYQNISSVLLHTSMCIYIYI